MIVTMAFCHFLRICVVNEPDGFPAHFIEFEMKLSTNTTTTTPNSPQNRKKNLFSLEMKKIEIDDQKQCKFSDVSQNEND